MKITKRAHACVSLEVDGTHLVVDPGTYTPDARSLLSRADAVLITHEHVDHLDADAVLGALAARPALELVGPTAVVDSLVAGGADPARLRAVTEDEQLVVAGVPVSVVVGSHAPVHDAIPVPWNSGYLIAGSVYHPGDSYLAPGVPVETLLVPISGPWTKLGLAIDFVRAVAPSRSIPVHDIMLSDIGIASLSRFLDRAGPTGVPLQRLEPGESFDV